MELPTVNQSDKELFDIFGSIKPFNFDENSSTIKLYRPPICCLSCGSYLSPFVQFIDLEWICSFCDSKNKCFFNGLTEVLHEKYPELEMNMFESSDVYYVEEHKQSNTKYNIGLCPTVMIAFDYCINDPTDIRELLLVCLSTLHPKRRISVASMSNCISIFRLLSIQSDPFLRVDTILGNRDDKVISLEPLIRQDLYTTTVAIALEFIESIVTGLVNISFRSETSSGVSEPRLRRPKPVCAINTLIEFAVRIGEVRNIGTHVCMFLTRTLSLNKTRSVVKDSTHAAHENQAILGTLIGREACRRGCWLDAVFVGLDVPRLDLLESVVSATGGYVITGQSLRETAVVDSITAMFRKPAMLGSDSTIQHPVEMIVFSNSLQSFPLYNSANSLPQPPGSPMYSISPLSPLSPPPKIPPPRSRSTTTGSPQHQIRTCRFPLFPSQGAVVTVQINTSSNLSLQSLIGSQAVATDIENKSLGQLLSPLMISTNKTVRKLIPIQAFSQLSPVSTNSRLSDVSSKSPFINESHVSNTLETIHACIIGSRDFSTGVGDDQIEEVCNKLEQCAKSSVLGCEFRRCDPSSEVTFQLQYDLDGRITRERSAERNQEDYESSLKRNTLRKPFEYIQCITRYFDRQNEVTYTRVISRKIPVVNALLSIPPIISLYSYFEALDWERQIVGIAKSIVIDYHDAVVERHGGAKSKIPLKSNQSILDTKSKDLDEEQHQDLRIIWCQVIDGYANRIANTLVKLCSELAVVDEESNVDNIRTIKAMSKQGSIAAHDKIFCMLQALYHFREGPLLDGPATQNQLAYLSRSHFLAAEHGHASCMLLPRVQLYSFMYGYSNGLSEDRDDPLNDSNQSTESAYLDPLLSARTAPLVFCESMPAESLSLLPSSAVVVDAGEYLLVRPPIDIDAEFSKGTSASADAQEAADTRSHLLEYAIDEATALCSGRFPCPPVHVLKGTYSPQYRLLYARLSPSHMDLRDLQSSEVPPRLAVLSEAERDYLINIAPITDQASFEKYIHKTAPQYAALRKHLQDQQNPNQSCVHSSSQLAEGSLNPTFKYDSTTTDTEVQTNGLVNRLKSLIWRRTEVPTSTKTPRYDKV